MFCPTKCVRNVPSSFQGKIRAILIRVEHQTFLNSYQINPSWFTKREKKKFFRFPAKSTQQIANKKKLCDFYKSSFYWTQERLVFSTGLPNLSTRSPLKVTNSRLLDERKIRDWKLKRLVTAPPLESVPCQNKRKNCSSSNSWTKFQLFASRQLRFSFLKGNSEDVVDNDWHHDTYINLASLF